MGLMASLAAPANILDASLLKRIVRLDLNHLPASQALALAL
jgi:hypothetical protein